MDFFTIHHFFDVTGKAQDLWEEQGPENLGIPIFVGTYCFTWECLYEHCNERKTEKKRTIRDWESFARFNGDVFSKPESERYKISGWWKAVNEGINKNILESIVICCQALTNIIKRVSSVRSYFPVFGWHFILLGIQDNTWQHIWTKIITLISKERQETSKRHVRK